MPRSPESAAAKAKRLRRELLVRWFHEPYVWRRFAAVRREVDRLLRAEREAAAERWDDADSYSRVAQRAAILNRRKHG